MYRIEQLLQKVSPVKIQKSFVSLQLYIRRKTHLKKKCKYRLKKKIQYIAFQYTLFPAHKALDISKNITVYILQALHRFILLDEHP